MSDDVSYASFLDKANQDSSSAGTQSKSSKYTTTSVNTSVPSSLQNVDATYVSDTDSQFEPVALSWTQGHLPEAKELAELIGHDSGEVEDVGAKGFDPRGQYKEVLEKVEGAGNGEIRACRVGHGKTRAEYYIISLDKKGERVVGLKAQAVES
ncbi:MAG: hypothetical protein M1821_003705 [Bathelium mastoideum]|nr:MAG: hypothetical protein M1821_003705 [Bathelium mastoideum]